MWYFFVVFFTLPGYWSIHQSSQNTSWITIQQCITFTYDARTDGLAILYIVGKLLFSLTLLHNIYLGRNVDTIRCGTIDGVALHSIGRTTALFVAHLPVIVIIVMIKYILQLGQIHFWTWTNIFGSLDKYNSFVWYSTPVCPLSFS